MAAQLSFRRLFLRASRRAERKIKTVLFGRVDKSRPPFRDISRARATKFIRFPINYTARYYSAVPAINRPLLSFCCR